MKTKQVPNCHNCQKPLVKVREFMDYTRHLEWNEVINKYILSDEDYGDDAVLLCEECSENLTNQEKSFVMDNYYDCYETNPSTKKQKL
jgi:hypothetical protein